MWFHRKSTDELVRELREEVAQLKRTVADRDLDWTEMRARCKRLLDRSEKQLRAIEEREPGPAGGGTSPSSTPLTAAPASASRVERIRQQLKAAGKEVPDGLLPG